MEENSLLAFDLHRLRADCKNRVAFNDRFLVGQTLGFESAGDADLQAQKRRLIRRSFLMDRERIAALILNGRISANSSFSGKFRDLSYRTDSEQILRQSCVVTVRLVYRPATKHIIRTIDVQVFIFEDFASIEEPEVSIHVWD